MTKTDTPILILIFNRPDKTRQLINALEKVRPAKIYVSADGPRMNVLTDVEKCSETRKLFENLPWDCTIYTNYSEINLGCKNGPVSGINWFFENVSEGIILEDDCIPNPSFFPFCTTLLDKYRNDSKVMHISGNNFQNGTERGDGSYYFSMYTHSWGWATWRRAWLLYRPALIKFSEFSATDQIDLLPLSSQAKRFWMKNFHHTMRGNDSWDSLWMYAVWKNKALAILPNKNLVSNIGFDTDATHTFTVNSQTNLQTESLEKIVDPTKKEPDREADEYTFRTNFYRPVLSRIFQKITTIISTYFKY